MIVFTADLYCDVCKTVIASGEPLHSWLGAVGSAIAAAKAKRAIAGRLGARCADCELAFQARNPQSPPSPPPNQVPIEG